MKVLILSPAPFDAFRRSKQFLALAFAQRGHEVLYVNPPVSPLSFVRSPSRLRHLVGDAITHPVPGITTWQPRVLPGQETAAAQRVNAALVVRGLRRLMPAPDLTIAFGLESRTMFGRLPGRRVYYCTDSLEDVPGNDPAVMRAREQPLIDAAQVVVACSRGLEAQLGGRVGPGRAPPVYIPHGCDEAFFVPRPDTLPELAGRPRPWVGYVGSINSRIDPALLDAARRGAGTGTLVLIGGRFGSGPPIDRATSELLARPDVVVVDEKDAATVPTYVAALDVGLAPYLDDDFNRKSFPLKIPQYLAAGVPVVSTPNGATEELGGVVRVAVDPAEFEAAVAAAAADPGDRATRIRRAGERPWTRNVDEVLRAAGLA